MIYENDRNWCASVGIDEEGAVALYQNWWFNDRHYICQFPCEFNDSRGCDIIQQFLLIIFVNIYLSIYLSICLSVY